MLPKHKQPSLEAGLMIADKTEGFAQLGKILNFPVILVVISVFTMGPSTGERMSAAKVSKIVGKVK